MDESWRMRMGMPSFPPRRSMGDASPAGSTTPRHSSATLEGLSPDDFADVFGGPPRSVLARKFSCDFTRSSSFYDEIFKPLLREFTSPPASARGRRILPAFRIPARDEGFYGDVFGAENVGRRSRERSRPGSKPKSNSKSNSSSVLSSEEVSPLRPVFGDDVALSSFASKLRPINVPFRWNTDQTRRQGLPAFACARPSFVENEYTEDEYYGSSYYGFSRRVSSPETISVEPSSYRSVKILTDDFELNSPSSPASSLCQEPDANTGMQSGSLMQEQEVEQDEDEVMSSFVIEISSDHREGTSEAVSIDEAIAWAKEKFHSAERQQEKDVSVETECDQHERSSLREFIEQPLVPHGTMHPPMAEERKDRTTEEETEPSEGQMEMELMDEDVRLWSVGKESNIRLLLSTLHHILWANSGWYAIPLMNLKETSQVKKAYQKVRLCLHPDKLQQKGATPSQKYIAEKAFSILQDAWAAFISEDGLIN